MREEEFEFDVAFWSWSRRGACRSATGRQECTIRRFQDRDLGDQIKALFVASLTLTAGSRFYVSVPTSPERVGAYSGDIGNRHSGVSAHSRPTKQFTLFES
jgi:hypothetical protein